MIWPDGDPSVSLLDHYYQLLFFLVTYVVPLVGLSVTYCHLGSVLWKDYHPQQSILNRRKVKDKRKVKLTTHLFSNDTKILEET